MSLEAHPSIKRELKAKILSMSDAELIQEIEKAPYAMNPMSIPFMKAILAERQAVKEAKHHEQMLEEAKRSNATSLRANRLSILAILISLAALVISLIRGI